MSIKAGALWGARREQNKVWDSLSSVAKYMEAITLALLNQGLHTLKINDRLSSALTIGDSLLSPANVRSVRLLLASTLFDNEFSIERVEMT